jgi:hypothetical protein
LTAQIIDGAAPGPLITVNAAEVFADFHAITARNPTLPTVRCGSLSCRGNRDTETKGVNREDLKRDLCSCRIIDDQYCKSDFVGRHGR